MSCSTKVIRIIVAACFCFASMLANSYGLNDRDGFNQQEAAYDSLISRKWHCDPVFHPERIVDWEFTEENRYKLVRELLEFRGCKDEATDVYTRELSAFIYTYVTFDYYSDYGVLLGFLNKDGEGRIDFSYPRGANRDYAVVIRSAKIHPTFDSDKRAYEERLLKEQAAAEEERIKAIEEDSRKQAQLAANEAEKARRERALNLRIAGLRNGTIKIASLDDAVLFHSPQDLDRLMVSPLLKPNNAIYSGYVLVDQDEGNGLIRVKSFNPLMMLVTGYQEAGVAYGIIRFTKTTVDYSVNDLRIGSRIKVVGKYSQNVKYGRIVPVLEVLYFGD